MCRPASDPDSALFRLQPPPGESVPEQVVPGVGLAFHDELSEARAWAEWAQKVYRTIAWLQPRDGANMEGPSYGAYGSERRVMYYGAARICFGENLYHGSGEREAGRWFLHMTLPGARARFNAFPRRTARRVTVRRSSGSTVPVPHSTVS